MSSAFVRSATFAEVEAARPACALEDMAALNTLTFASALYRLRRHRERLFPSQSFSEPTWDLLLDLLAAEKSGNQVSITSACIAAAAPTTTALRCLKQLEEQGVVYRQRDAADRRRTYIRLSTESVAAMEQLLIGFLTQAASR